MKQSLELNINRTGGYNFCLNMFPPLQYFLIYIQVRHKSVNRKCITVYCSFNGSYKVISPTEIVQSDLHCYLDI
jgi:hypothetical protein